MRRWHRTVGKWTVRGFLILIALFVIDLAILAYPNLLFAHKQAFGEFTVFSNQPLSSNFGQTIASVRDRVEAMENGRPGAKCRVYICSTKRRFSLFAFLTRKHSNSLAIGVSALGAVYINESKVRRFAAHNYGGIRHCRYEGNMAEVIAHEIAHFNVVKARGYRTAIKMPFWKSEGYAEYQANIAATRADSSYALADRVDLLMDRAFWGGGNSYARRLYEWHILVEYLAGEKGIDLDGLIDESITEATAREDMLVWYREQ